MPKLLKGLSKVYEWIEIFKELRNTANSAEHDFTIVDHFIQPTPFKSPNLVSTSQRPGSPCDHLVTRVDFGATPQLYLQDLKQWFITDRSEFTVIFDGTVGIHIYEMDRRSAIINKIVEHTPSNWRVAYYGNVQLKAYGQYGFLKRYPREEDPDCSSVNGFVIHFKRSSLEDVVYGEY